MRPILAVDDDVQVLFLVQRILEKAGYPVVTVDSAQAALDRIDDGLRPSLVILDLRMPLMDGNQLLERLRQGPAADVPKLVLSAYTDDLQEDSRASLAAVIDKPVSPKQLLEVVAKEIGSPVSS